MFLKPFRVKSNTQLRTSERKMFKALLLREFPKLTAADVEDLLPSHQPIFFLKLITHSKFIVTLYLLDKTPLIIQIENVPYPSLYMLWKFPHIVPAVTIWPQLSEKMLNGADLMLPGIVVEKPLHPGSYGYFCQGDIMAINTTTNKAPLAIGRAVLSSYDMYMAPQRGKAVKVLHTFGDTLWEFGQKIPMPEMGPPVEFGQPSKRRDISQNSSEYGADCSGLQTSSSRNGMDKEETDDTLVHENVSSSKCVQSNFGKVAEGIPKQLYSAVAKPNSSASMESDMDTDENILSESLRELTLIKSYLKIQEDIPFTDISADDMDRLVEYCFLKGLKTYMNKVELPLLTSAFYKLYMIPACLLGRRVDIKKSNYKKLSRFLNEMEKRGIVKVKELVKGVESIVYINENHHMLKEFVDMEPSRAPVATPGAPKPLITKMYIVSATVLPVFGAFGFRKGDLISIPDVRKYITEYVKREKLQDSVNKRMVNVNRTLQNIVQNPIIIALSWEDLMDLFLCQMREAYTMSFSGERSIAHKGKLEPIDIQIGRRTGNKKVTLINNLELYGINIQEFARECQHGVAASTSISTVPGKKSQQLLVQGNQVIFVANLLLIKYNIPQRHIRGIENASRQKK